MTYEMNKAEVQIQMRTFMMHDFWDENVLDVDQNWNLSLMF